MEPPWSDSPATLNGTGCFLLLYKLIFFGIYSAVFQIFCHWIRYDIVALFDSLYYITLSVCLPLFKVLNKLVTPAVYVYDPLDESDWEESESDLEGRRLAQMARNLGWRKKKIARKNFKVKNLKENSESTSS